MTDYSQTSVDDVALSIEQMLENEDNWDYAAQLIAAGQVPVSSFDDIARKFPKFWITHCIPNGSA